MLSLFFTLSCRYTRPSPPHSTPGWQQLSRSACFPPYFLFWRLPFSFETTVTLHSVSRLKAQLPPPPPPKPLSKPSALLPLPSRHVQMPQWMQCLLRSKRMSMPLPPLLPMRRVPAATASRVSSSLSDRSCSSSFPPPTPRRRQLTQVAFSARLAVLKPFFPCFPPLTLLPASASPLVYCAHGSVGDASVTGHTAAPHRIHLPPSFFISRHN